MDSARCGCFGESCFDHRKINPAIALKKLGAVHEACCAAWIRKMLASKKKEKIRANDVTEKAAFAGGLVIL